MRGDFQSTVANRAGVVTDSVLADKSAVATASSWRVRIFGVLASLALMILTPFLVFSESTVKGYIDSWLNNCIFALEIDKVRENRLQLTGFISGNLPKMLPITFSSQGALINRVQFVNEVERGTTTRYSNIGLHPQTDWACPGTLCESLGRVQSSPKMTVMVSDLHGDFVYPFYVDFDGAVEADTLRVFVQFEEGLKGGVCRVERANAFNLYMRLTKLWRFVGLCALFAMVTFMVGALRAWVKGGSDA